jgi:uroporphyrinogen decarboxylase
VIYEGIIELVMSTLDYRQPLPRQEVINAIERRHPARVPLIMTRWWGEGLVEQYGDRLKAFERYPQDVEMVWIEPLEVQHMGLSWPLPDGGAHDAAAVIDDWAKLDEFIAKMPDPATDPQIDRLVAQAEKARQQDRYLLFCWWRLFFERPWGLRGLQNLLMDYYIAPDQVHRLYTALCDLYCGYLSRAIEVLHPDGFWTSDDLGHQKNLFMRPDTFREFLKPYYQRIGAVVKPAQIHWWLHSCGNNAKVLDDLIEVGVDVFHPVQKGTMDEAVVARDFGDRLTFLAGFDVQHILQEATPDDVRQEVRHLINTFDRPNGGLCLAAGNGIVAGTPFENIEAFLDETLSYGTAHRQSVMV